MTYDEKRISNWMKRFCKNNKALTSNHLAEMCAGALQHWDWLHNPDHYVWLASKEYFNK